MRRHSVLERHIGAARARGKRPTQRRNIPRAGRRKSHRDPAGEVHIAEDIVPSEEDRHLFGWSSRSPLQESRYAAPQVFGSRVRLFEGVESRWCQRVKTSRAPAAFRRAGTQLRRDQCLVFKSIESRIDGARCNLPLKPVFDFLQNRSPVSLVFQAHNGDKHRLLECAKPVSHVYSVGIAEGLSNPFRAAIPSSRSRIKAGSENDEAPSRYCPV